MLVGKKSQVLNCSLVRKRCACGKQVTAKQLVLYSACDACVKAARARVAEITSKATKP